MSEFTRQQAVERFLYQEARLLDDRNFAQWVDLFTEDGLYWVPSGQDGPAEQAVALIYDTTARLRERLTRMLRRHRQALLSGAAHYRLQPAGDSFRIRQKVVTLQERDEAFDNLTFLI
jgi:3-phenylpropionate/cinnamic acid dioxygenase small subunit